MEYVRTYGLLILSLICALAAWGAYAYGLAAVNAEHDSVAAIRVADSQSSNRLATDRANKSLLRETEDGRKKLSQIAAGKDAIAVIGMLEGLGKTANTVLVVDSVGVDASLKGTDLRAVNVTAHAEGSFSQLFSVLKLLETMPAPGTVDSVELVHNDSSLWRLVVRCHILTKLD
jgi:hypothetical protein